MPRFAANLSLMYTEHAFLDRFEAAARDGFDAVEFLFPYAELPDEIALRLAHFGLEQVLFNAPPGDFAAGERGIACLPDRRAEFQRGFLEQALPFAAALHCPRVHVMAGIAPPNADRALLQDTYRANLAWAAHEAAAAGIDLMIEPINPRDMPGYLLNRQDDAHRLVQDIGAANLKVQMDLYHCQIVEGDVTRKLLTYLPTGRVGHLQIAGVPDRHEPDDGELNHAHLFTVLDELGWRGAVGCEYRPRGNTSAGLGWLRAYRATQGFAAG